MKAIRQGDVLLLPVAKLPKGAKEVAVKGDVIIAYGEVTGHAHRIKQTEEKPSASVYDFGAERYLQIAERVALTHEEHSAIFLERGTYRQAFQFEEKRAELQRVDD